MSEFKKYHWFIIGALTGLFVLFLVFPYINEWNNERQERQERVEYIESITQPELRIYQDGRKVFIYPSDDDGGAVFEYHFWSERNIVHYVQKVYPDKMDVYRLNNQAHLRDLIDQHQVNNGMHESLLSLSSHILDE